MLPDCHSHDLVSLIMFWISISVYRGSSPSSRLQHCGQVDFEEQCWIWKHELVKHRVVASNVISCLWFLINVYIYKVNLWFILFIAVLWGSNGNLLLQQCPIPVSARGLPCLAFMCWVFSWVLVELLQPHVFWSWACRGKPLPLRAPVRPL